MIKTQVPSRLSILVVDTDDYTRQEIGEQLNSMFSAIYFAENGRRGVEAFMKNAPDVVMCEANLSDMEGTDFVTKIREVNQDVPIMVTYDSYRPSQLLKLLEMDISTFLKKPVSRERIKPAVKKCVRNLLMKQALQEARFTQEHLLDAYPSFALMAQDFEVMHINTRLLNYLGHTSFEKYLRSKGIGRAIVKINGETYDGHRTRWMEMLVDDPLDRDHVIHLRNPRNPESRPQAFVVAFSSFPTAGKFLFTLSEISEIDDEKEQYQDDASRDPLTGAMNRRKFNTVLNREMMKFSRGGDIFSLVMFDIDHFKKVNDTYGHDAGDSVLREISDVVRKTIRENDQFVRWGGEEFIVLGAGLGEDIALKMAERLRMAVEKFAFTGVPGITSSFGVATASSGEEAEALLKRVDLALYEAKETGRNRVVQSGKEKAE